jgi:RNA polymerase sigma-70 factor (ECF subfamily)
LLDEQAQKTVTSGLRAGNRDAWAMLYDAYSADVWRYVARLLGQHASAVADVVQETFLEAAGSARRFDPERGSLWNWLTGIAHHRVAFYWRQTGRARERLKQMAARLPEIGDWLSDGQAPGERIEQLEVADLVRATLAELTAEYAALLTGKYVEDLSLVDLAHRWGGSTEAIKSKLARARREFRAEFERRADFTAETRRRGEDKTKAERR